MSMDSVNSSRSGTDYRSFRQITRDRKCLPAPAPRLPSIVAHRIKLSTKKSSKSAWKVLIMDKLTVKIMSFSCKMADVMEEGVSLVEDLYKRRQPLPLMDAIYFMQPTKENIRIFMSDMSGKIPLYKKAYVFFSSPVQRELVAQIKKDSNVLARIGALSEMNLEYFAIDSQGFTTDHDKALEELFSENAEGSLKYNSCLNMMATRVATVFASMREFPRVHYRVARTIDASTLTTLRDLVPTKLAAGVWNCLARFKAMIPEFPQTETCELLIVDRSIDQIAPIIHEWTYDAMCHDLLCMDGNKYVQEVPSKSGSGTENKEVLLEDHDPIWLELQHASERLHEKMTNFVSKNKAAQLCQARPDYLAEQRYLLNRDFPRLRSQLVGFAGVPMLGPGGVPLLRACNDTTGNCLTQGVPCTRYSEQIDKLALHVEIAGKLNSTIKEQQLKDVGQLEQDLVFGDAGTKELDISRENKLRLLLVYAAINPDKTRSDKGAKLMQKKHGIRKERIGEESKWMLSRFYPILEELIEKLSKGEQPKEEYHCLNDPSPSFRGIPSASTRTSPAYQPAQSMRSRRTDGTWARPWGSDDGYSSDSVLKHISSNIRKLGQRLFVFVIGGATRSELRAAHMLSSKLNREIILGSSSLDDPPQFITNSKSVHITLSKVYTGVDGHSNSVDEASEGELVVPDSMDAAGKELVHVVHVVADSMYDEAST
uniref:SNARE-interacting protein KEULE n=1 Tax=Oryza punctata TaxID=4537 RepID=A0A0E0KNE7_ORYPU